jgi:ABC-2 type transport system ATP-binding protein
VSSPANAIETHELTKSYGSRRGVFSLNLEVRQGEIFGFLGPNGAGKTVTIRMLLDLIRPQSGRAQVFGRDSRQDAVEIHRQTGYLPGELSLDPRLTGRQLLTYFSNLRKGVDWSFVELLASRLELNLNQAFGEYSRGNKQKLGVVQAFMHRPRLLILDEPTTALDPLHQQTVHEFVREAQHEGSTVFFSSHVLSEVESLCERVGFIREGRLVRVAAVQELASAQSYRIEVTFNDPPPREVFLDIDGVSDVEVEGDRLQCRVDGDMSEFIGVLAPYRPRRLVSREPSLNDVFLQMYEDAPTPGVPPSANGAPQ